MKEHRQKLNLIEFYRGIAALFVLFFHLGGIFSEKLGFDPLYGLGRLGFLGVDFFFVLSGFIIYTAHANDFGKREKITSFFKKRFFRIYPTYWFHLVLIIVIRILGGMVINSKFLEGLEFPNLLANVTLFPPEKYLIGPAWSLSYEIYFYLLFGVFLLGAKKWLWIFALYLGVIAVGFKQDAPILLNGHILQFGMGMGSAIILERKINIVENLKRHSGALLVLVLVCALLSLILFDAGKFLTNEFRIATMGLFSTAVIFFSVLFEQFKFQEGRGIHLPKSLLLFGAASYVLYISHGIFLSLFESAMSQIQPQWSKLNLSILYLVMILGCIVYAIVFHLLIEKRILSKYLKR